MDTEVLFTVTKDCLETGLRGYPIGYCPTSYVVADKGLFYLGRPIQELAFHAPEEVIYLLYYGKEGTQDEVDQFKKELAARAPISEKLKEHIKKLPREGHPMELFASSLLLAGMFEKSGNYRQDCLNLIARIPEITARVISHHAGWKECSPSRPELGYIENFLSMMNLPLDENLVEAMKLFNILHYDHGGGNLSTFVGKAVASGLEGMYGSMASAMCALAGPRHGRANQDCLEFVQWAQKEVGENPTDAQIEKLLRKRLAKKELIFGFGHAVLRVEDPRASIFYAVAQKKYPTHPLVKIALLLRTVGPRVLSEQQKISNPHPNVDGISGVMVTAAGFNYPEYLVLLFGMSRVVGISRQIVYEREEARGGKGTPIVRPSYFYLWDETVSG